MKAETVKVLCRYYASFASGGLGRIFCFSAMGRREHETMDHLGAAIGWICRAQDASGDGGVARSYSLVYNPCFRRKGWMASYPETTGYIIPTMFDYARLSGEAKKEIFGRAVRMADWECEVQMSCGAVQGGTVDQKRPATPAIFNTGQVIFGWLAAYRETGGVKYLRSAEKAGVYLAGQQDADGAWRKNLSDYASSGMDSYTYNARTAWALLLLHNETGEGLFRDAALKNLEFALTRQLENGWFESNCLDDPANPLLHTIAYAVRGFLESGLLADRPDFVERAKRAADALILAQRSDGGLAGRFNRRWGPAANWSCLAGDAQMALIWGRLFQVTAEEKYLRAMLAMNRYLKRAQLLHAGSADIHGGMGGSDPLGGAYGRFEVLSWAVKFFIDALMLEIRVVQDA